ncbi:MAG TPA: hypothetical protein VIH59_21560 [Candidatus Tectomicrobia bacterium]|jgi:type VI secretion system protein ImpC
MFNQEVRDSTQKKLGRVRVPHVRLTYDVEIGSAIDRLGSFMTRAECETLLNNWILQFVSNADEKAAAHRATFPLREARVDVAAIPGKPGIYRAVAFLRPHFQLEELSASMRVVVELPAPAR